MQSCVTRLSRHLKLGIPEIFPDAESCKVAACTMQIKAAALSIDDGLRALAERLRRLAVPNVPARCTAGETCHIALCNSNTAYTCNNMQVSLQRLAPTSHTMAAHTQMSEDVFVSIRDALFMGGA
jgi:hypothetical protein